MKGKSLSEMAPRLGGAPVLHGLIYAFAVAFGAILLATMLLTWSSIPEAKLPVIVYIINLASVLTGSFVAARRTGEKGWYYGGLTGLFYSVAITILGFMLVSASFTLHNLVQIALLSSIGGLGGIIGVNTKSR
ncbi:TIGR04086 family membrane protein [Effusibacillus consociatus]|uniref:TIGR04086 family membrane protein n=1 Tax=Effusibacillus consociatus TaxID=1117041 RepID=A0ABV9Q876_9BACL